MITEIISLIKKYLKLNKVNNNINRTSDKSTGIVNVALADLIGKRKKSWKRIHLDNKYWLCSQEEFQTVVEHNKINEKTYIYDQFDCDNFAFAFKAQVAMNHNLNNVGIVIDNSGGHAYNVVVFRDGTAKLFEPQTDAWVEPGSAPLYKFDKGIIII